MRRNAAYKPCRIHQSLLCWHCYVLIWLVYILLYKLINNYYAGIMLMRIWPVIDLQYECYWREYV